MVDTKTNCSTDTDETGSGMEYDSDAAGVSHSSNTRIMVGSCTFHEDPDLWFPEMPRGRPTRYSVVAKAEQVREAVDICSTCPVRVECREDGFLPENLLWGIRGGMLPADRLIAAGVSPEDYSKDTVQGQAFAFAKLVRPWLHDCD